MATDDPFNLTSDNRPVRPDNDQQNPSGATGSASQDYPERSAASGLNQARKQEQEQAAEPTTGSDADTARGRSIGGYEADTGAGDRYATPTEVPSGANGNSTFDLDAWGNGGRGPTEADYEGAGTSDSGEIVGGG